MAPAFSLHTTLLGFPPCTPHCTLLRTHTRTRHRFTPYLPARHRLDSLLYLPFTGFPLCRHWNTCLHYPTRAPTTTCLLQKTLNGTEPGCAHAPVHLPGAWDPTGRENMRLLPRTALARRAHWHRLHTQSSATPVASAGAIHLLGCTWFHPPTRGCRAFCQHNLGLTCCHQHAFYHATALPSFLPACRSCPRACRHRAPCCPDYLPATFISLPGLPGVSPQHFAFHHTHTYHLPKFFWDTHPCHTPSHHHFTTAGLGPGVVPFHCPFPPRTQQGATYTATHTLGHAAPGLPSLPPLPGSFA